MISSPTTESFPISQSSTNNNLSADIDISSLQSYLKLLVEEGVEIPIGLLIDVQTTLKRLDNVSKLSPVTFKTTSYDVLAQIDSSALSLIIRGNKEASQGALEKRVNIHLAKFLLVCSVLKSQKIISDFLQNKVSDLQKQDLEACVQEFYKVVTLMCFSFKINCLSFENALRETNIIETLVLIISGSSKGDQVKDGTLINLLAIMVSIHLSSQPLFDNFCNLFESNEDQKHNLFLDMWNSVLLKPSTGNYDNYPGVVTIFETFSSALILESKTGFPSQSRVENFIETLFPYDLSQCIAGFPKLKYFFEKFSFLSSQYTRKAAATDREVNGSELQSCLVDLMAYHDANSINEEMFCSFCLRHYNSFPTSSYYGLFDLSKTWSSELLTLYQVANYLGARVAEFYMEKNRLLSIKPAFNERISQFLQQYDTGNKLLELKNNNKLQFQIIFEVLDHTNELNLKECLNITAQAKHNKSEYLINLINFLYISLSSVSQSLETNATTFSLASYAIDTFDEKYIKLHSIFVKLGSKLSLIGTFLYLNFVLAENLLRFLDPVQKLPSWFEKIRRINLIPAVSKLNFLFPDSQPGAHGNNTKFKTFSKIYDCLFFSLNVTHHLVSHLNESNINAFTHQATKNYVAASEALELSLISCFSVLLLSSKCGQTSSNLSLFAPLKSYNYLYNKITSELAQNLLCQDDQNNDTYGINYNFTNLLRFVHQAVNSDFRFVEISAKLLDHLLLNDSYAESIRHNELTVSLLSLFNNNWKRLHPDIFVNIENLLQQCISTNIQDFQKQQQQQQQQSSVSNNNSERPAYYSVDLALIKKLLRLSEAEESELDRITSSEIEVGNDSFSTETFCSSESIPNTSINSDSSLSDNQISAERIDDSHSGMNMHAAANYEIDQNVLFGNHRGMTQSNNNALGSVTGTIGWSYRQ